MSSSSEEASASGSVAAAAAEPVQPVSAGHADKPHQCAECGSSFTRGADLRRHIRSSHEHQASFVCTVCDAAFTLKSVLVDHLLTHTGATPFACAHCDASFKSRRSRSRHMHKLHPELAPAKAKPAARKAAAGSHGSAASSAAAPAAASRKRGRPKRRDSTSSDSSCSEDGSEQGEEDGSNSDDASDSFDAVPALQMCGECGSLLPTAAALREHMLQQHAAAAQPAAESDSSPAAASASAAPPARKRPRPTAVFTCEWSGCGATFHYRHVLANHVRAKHTHEELFRCGTCARGFPTLARQRAHEKTHIKLLE